MDKNFKFSYLQIHSAASPFGGTSGVAELAEGLKKLANLEGPVAAALTDTFSMASVHHWHLLMEATGNIPLYGVEIGLNWGRSNPMLTIPPLPASLLLLPENLAGYYNLCRLVSSGLSSGGSNPLTAGVDLHTLSRFQDGLIAISPYHGGPVMASLRLKLSEGRTKAQILRDIFGKDRFFLGVPSPAGQRSPNTAEDQHDARISNLIRLNAALVKLARDLKIELAATGETRYVKSSEAHLFTSLRNRLGRALAAQYTPASLLQPQDWLYSVRPDRPTYGYEFLQPSLLIAHYNDKDWPGALSNNLIIGERCSSWKFREPEPFNELRNRCETELNRRFMGNDGQLPEERQSFAWLNSELADIAELGIAGPLLAASKAVEAAREIRQIVISRRLSGSLCAGLLGLSFSPPETSQGDSFNFDQDRRPLRLDVGHRGRSRLLTALNSGGKGEEEWKAAPVAVPSHEPGHPPLLHPNLISFTISSNPIGVMAPLIPAQSEGGAALHLGVQLGTVLPPNIYWLEVTESAGVARLQLALDIYNEWRISHGSEPILPEELPQPSDVGEGETGVYEGLLVEKGLEWFRENTRAAYYAAVLSLSRKEERAGIGEAVRKAGMKLLPPSINSSRVHFSLENEDTIVSGLSALIEWQKAEALVAARPFSSLSELIRACPLTQEDLENLAWSGSLDELAGRESVAASAASLAQEGLKWQEQKVAASKQSEVENRNETAGQLTLFNMLEQSAPAQESAQLEGFDLPEVEPIPPLPRLRREFMALGFYTANHPLWDILNGQGTDETRAGPLSLIEVAAKKGIENDQAPLLLAGMTVGLRRLPFTESNGKGQELTVLQLEDWTGWIELLVPPSLTANLAELQLAEGRGLTVVARWVKSEPGKTYSRPVLVAEALSSFPPEGKININDDEESYLAALDLEDASNPTKPSDLGNFGEKSGAEGEDDGWSTSLFAEYSAQNSEISAGSPGSKSTSGPSPSPSKSKGRPSERREIHRVKKHVHITLNLSGDELADEEIMTNLKTLLREHPGEDALHLYLKWPDGETSHLEPQSLNVEYSPRFVEEVSQFLGGEAQNVRVEERAG